MGRPPKPLELKIATGRSAGRDSGGRKLNVLATVTTLPMAHEIPAPPDGLSEHGVRLWNRCWSEAITWLSPDSDIVAVESVCRTADLLEVARQKYSATHDSADGRLVVAMTKSLADGLSAIGFDPTSRARLGVGLVRAVSALDKLIEKRSKHSG